MTHSINAFLLCPEGVNHTSENVRASKTKLDLFSSVSNVLSYIFTCIVSSADVGSLFLATISTETMTVSDDEPIPWDLAPINPAGHFSTVTGGYTAPYNGYYQYVLWFFLP